VTAARAALCLPGGGLTGAMYQIGALAALEDGLREGELAPRFSVYVGASSGATVAASLAGGIPIDRIYRALLDPASVFFPLERGHVLHLDLDEWNRTLSTAGVAIRHGLARLATRKPSASSLPHHFVLEQVDRLNDSLPAGLFRLDRYERFLAEFFLRRGIPNAFGAMPRPLRIAATDLDSGERVVFGAEGQTTPPVSLACAASVALPLFFSPVRIGDSHYLDGGLERVAHLDVAAASGAALAVVVNPLVPLDTGNRAVPTGHGARQSVRDKGLLGVFDQSMRIGSRARLVDEIARQRELGGMQVLVIEPEPADVVLFLHNPVNFDARRAILEYAYKATRGRLAKWVDQNRAVLDAVGWRAA
jgi:predicted acylesterase/phospholipase RssA